MIYRTVASKLRLLVEMCAERGTRQCYSKPQFQCACGESGRRSSWPGASESRSFRGRRPRSRTSRAADSDRDIEAATAQPGTTSTPAASPQACRPGLQPATTMGATWCPGHRYDSAVSAQDDGARPFVVARSNAHQLEPDRPTNARELILRRLRRIMMPAVRKTDDAHISTLGRTCRRRSPNDHRGPRGGDRYVS